jgi:hypothetical protein
MTHDPDLKNQSQSPRSVFGTKSGHNCEVWFFLLLNKTNRSVTASHYLRLLSLGFIHVYDPS